jgi:hypothetical protein
MIDVEEAEVGGSPRNLECDCARTGGGGTCSSGDFGKLEVATLRTSPKKKEEGEKKVNKRIH